MSSDADLDAGSDYAGETPGTDDGSGDGGGSDGDGGDGGDGSDGDGGDGSDGDGDGSDGGDGSDTTGTDTGSTPGGSTGGGATGGSATGGTMSGPTMLSTGCASAYGADVYTPFPNYGPVSVGTVTTYPWRGPSTYPDSLEDFRAYSAPSTVECGRDKSVRDHVDVTAGCLHAVANGGDTRGQIELTSDGYYRSFALPYDAQNARPVAWGDQGVEYEFFDSAWTGTAGNPGFKAFVRYLTEYDLYVASWRRDGVVQIQKKQCGVYTTLKRIATYGAPSLNTWHTIRFQAVGSELRLWLDGQLAITINDTSITHGTAGIRIDSANGALIDDWRAYAP